MMTASMEVKDILKEAVTISEDTSFKDAIALMIEKKTNSLLVTNEAGELIGEVSVADLLRAVVPEYLSDDSVAAHFATGDMFDESVQDAAEKQVTFFMTTKTHPVKATESVMAVATNAIAYNRVRIPVVDEDNKPVGMVSRRGLKHIIGDALGIKDSE